MASTISKYYAFIETAKRGSFTKAAKSLSYSQSAVSRMVMALESQWNVTLFERGKDTVTLTSQGKELLPIVEQICQGNNHLLLKLKQQGMDPLSSAERTIIRIAAPSSIITAYFPSLLENLYKDYPNVNLQIYQGTYAEIERLVVEKKVDMGIMPVACSLAGIVSIPFEHDELVVVSSLDHRFAYMENIDINEFINESFIADKECAPLLQSQLKNLRITFNTSDVSVILALVQRNLGVSLLPELAVRQSPHQVAIRHLKDRAYRSIHVVYRSDTALSLPAECMLSYMKHGLSM